MNGILRVAPTIGSAAACPFELKCVSDMDGVRLYAGDLHPRMQGIRYADSACIRASSCGQLTKMLICAASNRFRFETLDKGATPQQSEEVGVG